MNTILGIYFVFVRPYQSFNKVCKLWLRRGLQWSWWRAIRCPWIHGQWWLACLPFVVGPICCHLRRCKQSWPYVHQEFLHRIPLRPWRRKMRSWRWMRWWKCKHHRPSWAQQLGLLSYPSCGGSCCILEKEEKVFINFNFFLLKCNYIMYIYACM